MYTSQPTFQISFTHLYFTSVTSYTKHYSMEPRKYYNVGFRYGNSHQS